MAEERELPDGYEVIPDYEMNVFRLYCGKEHIRTYSMGMYRNEFDPTPVYDYADAHAKRVTPTQKEALNG